MSKVYTSAQSFKTYSNSLCPLVLTSLCGVVISVFDLRKKGKCVGVFGNKSNATEAGSSVVVECENVPLFSFG